LIEYILIFLPTWFGHQEVLGFIIFLSQQQNKDIYMKINQYEQTEFETTLPFEVPIIILLQNLNLNK